jgi:hypothetical protein
VPAPDEPVIAMMGWRSDTVSPSSDGYVGRSPKGMRAGLGAARRSAHRDV